MQLWILPVCEAAVAVEGGAAEMDDLILIFQETDVAAEEEVLAPGAEAHLVEGPPLLERVVSLQEFQLAPEGGDEGVQMAVGVIAFFGHSMKSNTG